MPASPKRSGRCTCRPTTRHGRNGDRLDPARRSSSNRIVRACVTRPALTLFRGGQYDEAQAGSRARARAAADLRRRDAAARHGADAPGPDRRGPRRIQEGDGASAQLGGGAYRHGPGALQRRRDYQEALDAFEKAIALSPSSAISLTRAGAAAQQLGDNTSARSITTNGPTPFSRAPKRFRTWARSITVWATSRRPPPRTKARC